MDSGNSILADFDDAPRVGDAHGEDGNALYEEHTNTSSTPSMTGREQRGAAWVVSTHV